MIRRGIVTLALLAALGASPAAAWEPIYPTEPVWHLPVPYSLHQAGSVDLGGFAATEPEVRRGMEDWTRVSCTSLTTNYRGSTTRRPGDSDGVSTIGWVESGWRHGSSAIGVTGPRFGSYIVEADMELNGVNFTWTTGPGSWSTVNTYSIVLHEGGHYYGLGHSNVRGSSMWPSYAGGIVGLGPDDEAGICALYPGSGSDCTTTGCPSGQECVSGECRPAMGDGSVCSPCTSHADCGGANDYCLGYPDGRGYCGRACRSDADCGGDRCVSTSGGPQCVRFSGTMPTCTASSPGCTRDTDCDADEICSGGTCVPRPATGRELGEACAGDSDCRSGLCLAGACSQSCDWLEPASCPSGFYCNEDPSSCGNGFCVRGAAGPGGLGAPCSADTDCASLYCDGGVCTQPCIPSGAVGCPSGYTCQVGTLPCRGSCGRGRALGDACDSNVDCTSGACAVRGTETFCTQLCDEGAPCPEGFTCTPAGDLSVCAPDRGGLDAPCSADGDCASGLCTVDHGAMYCTRPCAEGCPAGFVCGDTDSHEGVCVREERGLGQECAANDDCASGLCAMAGDDTFCTQFCSDEAPCPSGFACAEAGEARVCRPTGATGGRGGCGCRVAGPSGAPLVLGLPLLLLLVVRRRRR